MLSIQAVSAGGDYHAYLTSEYYLDAAQVVRWDGQGAKELGLVGDVTADDFKEVFKGFRPNKGGKLVQNAGQLDRQPGWDLTFSAPKDVSALWAVADEATRVKIGECHAAAVRDTLAYVEDVAGLSRQDKGQGTGKKDMQLVKAGLVIATFGHGASREKDPQLHTHCFVFNAGVRKDGTTGSLYSNEFYRHKMAGGALYQAALSNYLMSRLGLAIRPDRHGFGIEGVPAELSREWSKRRDQIEVALGGQTASAQAAAVAAATTRRGKEPGKVSGLFERWRETAAKHDFDSDKAKGLLDKVSVLSGPMVKEQFARLTNDAVEKLLLTQSHISKRETLRAMANAVRDGTAPAQDIRDAVAGFFSRPDVVEVGAIKNETRFTTRAVIELERQLLFDMRSAAMNKEFQVSDWDKGKLLGERFPSTGVSPDDAIRNAGQKAAAEHLLRPDGVSALSGMAGTGKSTVLKTCREVWEKAGYVVTGMALAGVAGKNLAESAGIESDTIAMRLIQLDQAKERGVTEQTNAERVARGKKPLFHLTPKSVVVVDEAGMVGTNDMARLSAHVREAGAKLVLVGDSGQLQPVAAGAPFLRVEKELGRAELTHITRQSLDQNDHLPAWRRQAVTLFADGNAQEALKLFEERKLVSTEANKAKAIQKLVTDWATSGGATEPTKHMILAGTNEDVRGLNTLCQRERQKLLDPDGVSKFAEVNGQRLHAGDRVLFTKKSRELGLDNGELGTVAAVSGLGDKKTLSVLVDDGRTVTVPLSTYSELKLGYAMTTHKAQGATVPHAYVLLGGSMQDRHLSYVQASRARENTRFYCDRFEAGKGLEQIAKQMAQSRQKDLAHDLMQPVM